MAAQEDVDAGIAEPEVADTDLVDPMGQHRPLEPDLAVRVVASEAETGLEQGQSASSVARSPVRSKYRAARRTNSGVASTLP